LHPLRLVSRDNMPDIPTLLEWAASARQRAAESQRRAALGSLHAAEAIARGDALLTIHRCRATPLDPPDAD
jgi:hypothetical protein